MQQVAPYLTTGLGITIGLLFLIGVLRYLLPVASMARQLTRAAHTLQRLNAPPKQHPFGSRPKAQLTELWKEFVRQCERALVTVKGEHISTVAPEDISVRRRRPPVPVNQTTVWQRCTLNSRRMTGASIAVYAYAGPTSWRRYRRNRMRGNCVTLLRGY